MWVCFVLHINAQKVIVSCTVMDSFIVKYLNC